MTDDSGASGAQGGVGDRREAEPRGETHDPFTYIGAILAGLQQAAPEATEHLARALYELLLAARAVFEAMGDAIAEAEGREGTSRIETIPIRNSSGAEDAPDAR